MRSWKARNGPFRLPKHKQSIVSGHAVKHGRIFFAWNARLPPVSHSTTLPKERSHAGNGGHACRIPPPSYPAARLPGLLPTKLALARSESSLWFGKI